ncbi:hypothetical protein [Boseongicola sp. H5]|uniref:hypothetical protein n=1 Tax=Boseongicola sp. H5 TaxID=2763261 RepID=UPI001D0AD2BA|nr:hypothetical protein [Boseongicola sp. H5]
MLARLTPLSTPETGLPRRALALPLEPETKRELAWLRVAGARCRVMRRSDLFHACAVLSLSGEQAALAYAQALFRALPGLLPGGLRLYAPGDAQVSFDEAWLLQLLNRARAGDLDSLTFLIGRRIAPHARRQVAFLIQRLAATKDIRGQAVEKNCA